MTGRDRKGKRKEGRTGIKKKSGRVEVIKKGRGKERKKGMMEEERMKKVVKKGVNEEGRN